MANRAKPPAFPGATWPTAGAKTAPFHGLPLEENLKSREAETRCGLMVVDLTSGDAPHWVRLEGVVKELYDVAFLPGCTSPMAIGFVSDEVTRMIRVAPAQE